MLVVFNVFDLGLNVIDFGIIFIVKSIHFFIHFFNNVIGFFKVEFGERFECLNDSSPLSSLFIVIFLDFKSKQEFVILDKIGLVT